MGAPFKTVLRDILRFLEEQPSETILMILRSSHGKVGKKAKRVSSEEIKRLVIKMFGDKMNKKRLDKGTRIGEMRGKVVPFIGHEAYYEEEGKEGEEVIKFKSSWSTTITYKAEENI